MVTIGPVDKDTVSLWVIYFMKMEQKAEKLVPDNMEKE